MFWMQGIGTKMGCAFEHKKGRWLTIPKGPEKPKRENKKLGVITLEDGTEGTVVELFNSKRNPGLSYQTILYRLKKGVRYPDALFAPQHHGVSLPRGLGSTQEGCEDTV